MHLCAHSSPRLAFDRDPVSAASEWRRARKVETQYATRLRQIAKHISDIVSGMWDGDFAQAPLIEAALERYANILEPWAVSVAQRMITEVDARDKAAWRRVSAQMGRAIGREIQSAPTGLVMQDLMAAQVTLIKSLPLEAAQRVHELAIEGISNGSRGGEISDMIARSGEVSRSRAVLIARTETSRAHTTLTQARAEYVGSEGYIWRTAKDSDVRPSHKRLDGKFVRWDDPPECDPGYHAHAGAIFNCRCHCEPVL